MNKLLAALTLLVVVALAGIAYQLHGLNRRLDEAAARNWGWPKLAAAAGVAAATPESDEQRRRARKALVDQMIGDLEWSLEQEAAKSTK